MDKINILKEEILKKTRELYKLKFGENKNFVPGETYVNYGGRYFDSEEMVNLVDSSLDFWLTSGPWCKDFESKMAEYLNVKFCSLTNSGSSANLLALTALTSYKLGERRIKRDDEVITVAAGFPTTITPIIQNNAIPVFVDVDKNTYNIDVDQLEVALSVKTKAVMIAHSLGNPFDLSSVKDFCDRHNLWLIEDNCDALGSEYLYKGEWRKTGTIGDIGTSSFYPPHHMTMGEGGAVYTDNPILKRLINSFRDWGRDCWCDSGRDNTCNHRFTEKFGELPVGYDHKYVYSHFGYNLKVTDMQAAVGMAQLGKMDYIVMRRRENWDRLSEGLKEVSDVLQLPVVTENSKPSWFGYLITVKDNAGFKRNDIVKYLEDNFIQTRNLFAGNILKHPAFTEDEQMKNRYRIVGDLTNTDNIMHNTFWIGVYPGMTSEMIDYMVSKIVEFVKK